MALLADDTSSFDDASSTTSSLHKPAAYFDEESEHDGFVERIPQRRSWWRRIRRRNAAMKEGLYGRRGKRRSLFNYCVFGGISGLTIL